MKITTIVAIAAYSVMGFATYGYTYNYYRTLECSGKPDYRNCVLAKRSSDLRSGLAGVFWPLTIGGYIAVKASEESPS